MQIVAGIVGCYPRLLALHLVVDLVHDIALYQGLLLDELICCAAKLVLIFGVNIYAKQQLGDRKSVAGVIEHEDLAGIFFVPEQIPRTEVCLVNILFIIDKPHSAPCVRHGIFIIRVKGRIFVRLIDKLIVGNV